MTMIPGSCLANEAAKREEISSTWVRMDRTSHLHATDMCTDIRRGEYITGFNVRAGVWIDAIQVLTSLGRRSPMFGNAHGGSSYVCPRLITPK